jgi:hypothetical protein
MSYAIYVLTDLDREPLNKYKIGSHKGHISKLRSRYITSMPNLTICYFMETNNAKNVENEFKSSHIQERIYNDQQNLSEWVIMPLNEIFKSLCVIIAKSKMTLKNPTYSLDFNNEKDHKIRLTQHNTKH